MAPGRKAERGHALSEASLAPVHIGRARGRKREREADVGASSLLCPTVFQGHDLWQVFRAARMLPTVLRHVLRYAREDHVCSTLCCGGWQMSFRTRTLWGCWRSLTWRAKRAVQLWSGLSLSGGRRDHGGCWRSHRRRTPVGRHRSLKCGGVARDLLARF